MDDINIKLVHCTGCDMPSVCLQRGCRKSLRDMFSAVPPCKCPDTTCLRHNSFADNTVRMIGQ